MRALPEQYFRDGMLRVHAIAVPVTIYSSVPAMAAQALYISAALRIAERHIACRFDARYAGQRHDATRRLLLSLISPVISPPRLRDLIVTPLPLHMPLCRLRPRLCCLLRRHALLRHAMSRHFITGLRQFTRHIRQHRLYA